ncbi:capsular polysaccharide biosynthesis protein [Flavobacteriaceae bacterium GF1]
MFTFFSKKGFLVDYLAGFIDIHNHILPGIDDGAKNVGESMELIKGFAEIGVTDFICTPHIMSNYYDNTPETIGTSYEKLKKNLNRTDFKGVNLNYAAEHMIDDNFDKILANNEVLPLNKDHILIEMSYLQPSINFEASIELIKNAGYFPVLAHPERYQYLSKDFKSYLKYKSAGVKFQLNLLSLGGHYGEEIKRTSWKLLDTGNYDFLGSDVHNLSHLKGIRSIKIKKAHINEIQVLKHRNAELFQN